MQIPQHLAVCLLQRLAGKRIALRVHRAGKPLHAFPFIVGDEDDLDAGIPDPADKGDRLCVWKGLIMRGQSIVDIAHEHADPMPLEPLQIQRTVAFHIIIRGKQLHVASSSHRRHYNTEYARMEKLFTA